MKIDIFSHITPVKYLEALRKRTASNVNLSEISPWMQKNAALSDVKTRLKALATTPGTAQVLTLGTPPLETMVSPKDAIELSRIANDEMAELVEKYPDKFVAAVGCLPLNDIDASVKEAERAITKLGFKGVQIFSNINGETLDLPKFRPLYKKMAQHDLPIWIHPWDEPGIPRNNPLHWPYQTSLAMVRLVFSGVLVDYPDIKFIAHHCGGMIPFFEKRITKLSSGFIMEGKRVEDPVDDLRKFYVDTALYGGTPALMCGYAFFGADHMLYGTDAPLGGTPITRGDTVMYGHALETAHAIEQMNIPAKEKDKIFERNARRLLKLEN